MCSNLISFCTLFTDKDRELGDALAEIKALKYSERLKEKAVEEVLTYPQCSTMSLSCEMTYYMQLLYELTSSDHYLVEEYL